MEKHICTFGELNIGDTIYRYSTNSDQVERLKIKNIINIGNKVNIYIDNDDHYCDEHYCVDKDRTYVTGNGVYVVGNYVLTSDYELKEVIDTVIYITKKYMGETFNKMFNYMFKT